jgi:carbamoyl-phosphate synthase large subunit
MGIGKSFGEAYAKAQASVGGSLPTMGTVFVSVNDEDKPSILPVCQELAQMGFKFSATRGTARFLSEHGIQAEVIKKIQDGHPNVVDYLRSGQVSLLINTPKGSVADDAQIRIEAVRRKVPYTTTVSAARAAVQGIRYLQEGRIDVEPIPNYAEPLNY